MTNIKKSTVNQISDESSDNNSIAVIIVTYNAAKTLQACLNSIFKQTHKNIELIVIDGASTDGTIKILEENDLKISFWLSEKDSGIYDAMNKALQYVTSEWIYFLGADDELLTDFSKMALVLKNPTTIYHGNVIFKTLALPGNVDGYFQAKVGIFHQAIIYPKLVFEKFRYNLKYPISADYELNMRCWRDKMFSFQYTGYTIAFFNDTGKSFFGADEIFKKDKLKLIAKNFGLLIWLRCAFREIKIKYFGKQV